LTMKLRQIEIIPPEEKKQILVDFNDTVSRYPKNDTIHRLFEERAAKHPHRAALVYEDGFLTYRRLNEKADRLAACLRSRGVGEDNAVGIMSTPSLEMIVGVLGILKAGGAYLPVNPRYPTERKTFLLQNANARLLLSNRTEPGEWTRGLETISLNNPRIYNYDDDDNGGTPDGNGSPRQLAYIIYTSGSTGRPKGVMVTHRNVVRLVKNTNYVPFRETDRVLQTGALEFDASTFETWGSLLNSTTLYLAAKETLLDTSGLEQTILRHDIATMWMTAPLFNRMLQTDIGIFSGLKDLLVGGDVLSPYHINRLRGRFPGLHVINGYGPTENTTFSTTFSIDRDYAQNIPIGKPIANSTAYIVDRYHRLQPVGVVGELLVGGDGVARGYLNDPELTARKFVDFMEPKITRRKDFSHGRVYCTGDLARWLPGGNIQFLGRIDHQVKIRGFRIEPGEIEKQLLDHPRIKEAVVSVREKQDGDKYLCAYLVPLNEDAPRAGGLEPNPGDYLADFLPDHMIPAFFVELET
ncbi:MAG: amino acid adenylation domain-containing protein, partial [bacterium]|nr:amino acid adenylation domain-containing protein [bacterium]